MYIVILDKEKMSENGFHTTTAKVSFEFLASISHGRPTSLTAASQSFCTYGNPQMTLSNKNV